MKKPDLSNEELEEILRRLPPVRDQRGAAQVYQSIQLNEIKRKKIKYVSTPLLVSVIALFILALISPYFSKQFKESNMSEQHELSSNSSQPSLENDYKAATLSEEKSRSVVDETVKTFVIRNEESDRTVTVAFPDKGSKTIVPLSVEGNSNENKVGQINDILETVNHEELGLNVNPLKGVQMNISGDNSDEVIVNVEDPHTITSFIDKASFYKLMSESLRWQGVREVKFYTNGKPGIEFDDHKKIEHMKLKQIENKGYFIFEVGHKSKKLLVPSSDPYDSILDALTAMKKDISTENLKPSILKNISNIEVNTNGKQVNIMFKDASSFEDSEPYIMMLEAILLTAKDFGYESVKFNGIGIDHVGQMDVTKPINVPYSPNPIK